VQLNTSVKTSTENNYCQRLYQNTVGGADVDKLYTKQSASTTSTYIVKYSAYFSACEKHFFTKLTQHQNVKHDTSEIK